MSTSQASPTESARPRGRRPAGGDTRGTILAAARDEFAERGYDGASIRSVARRAEVDPALVRHYFQDKAELFAAGMIPAAVDPAELVSRVTAGGVDGLGERLLTAVLGVWESDGGAAFRVAFAGLSSSEVQAEALLGYVGREVFDEVAELLPGPDPATGLAGRLAGGRRPACAQRHAPRADRVAADPAGGRARGADAAALPHGRSLARRGTARRSRPSDERDLQREPCPRRRPADPGRSASASCGPPS